MQVEFGAPVFGAGGKRLGEVDGLVVNAGTKRASAIIVDAGLFDRGKHMIGVSAVTRSDQDGLYLDEPAATSEADVADPRLRRSVDCPTRRAADGVHSGVRSWGAGLRGQSRRVREISRTTAASFEIAPLDPPVVEVKSNLGQNEVVLGSETHAISNDHERLGNVAAFELGDMGLVESVTVSEGLIFKERSTFPLTEIDEFGTNAVHLRLTRSAAEATLINSRADSCVITAGTVAALGNSPAPVLRSILATRAGLSGARHLVSKPRKVEG